MREGASYPPDVREDLALVVGALRGGRERTTEQLAEDCARPLARVRGALQLLKAADVLAFTAHKHGRLEGYARVWKIKGAGVVQLWEPIAGGRRRRLFVTRTAAVEASRRTRGPEADARAVVVLVSKAGEVGG